MYISLQCLFTRRTKWCHSWILFTLKTFRAVILPILNIVLLRRKHRHYTYIPIPNFTNRSHTWSNCRIWLCNQSDSISIPVNSSPGARIQSRKCPSIITKLQIVPDNIFPNGSLTWYQNMKAGSSMALLMTHRSVTVLPRLTYWSLSPEMAADGSIKIAPKRKAFKDTF